MKDSEQAGWLKCHRFERYRRADDLMKELRLDSTNDDWKKQRKKIKSAESPCQLPLEMLENKVAGGRGRLEVEWV